MTTPKYTHDSTCCTFLGRTTHDGTEYDLYYCNKTFSGETVICRDGDDGPNYRSGIIFGEQGLEPCATALRLAHDQGLTKNQAPERTSPPAPSTIHRA